MIFLKFKNVSPYGKMIDHVSGLDWKKNLRSLDWKKNLRSKNGIFKKLPLPIFCVFTAYLSRDLYRMRPSKIALRHIRIHDAISP